MDLLGVAWGWIGRNPGEAFFIVLFHLIWIGLIAYRVARMRRIRLLESRPLTPINAAIAGNDVMIEGRVVSVGVTRSFLRSRPAAWYDWKVERHEYDPDKDVNDRDRDRWVHEDSGKSIEPLAVEDQAGNRIVVLPERAAKERFPEHVWHGPTTTPPPDGRSRSPTDYRYTERLLAPGELVTVTGRLAPARPGGGPGVRGLLAGAGDIPFMIGVGHAKAIAHVARGELRGISVFIAIFFLVACGITWALIRRNP